MQSDRDNIRRLAEKKLRQQIVRHDRDLRLIVGHFDVLDHIDDYKVATPSAPSTTLQNSPVQHGTPTLVCANQHSQKTSLSTTSPREEAKYGAATTCIEVGEVEVDEDGSSDEESISEEDDAMELGGALARVQSHHAQPMFVSEDAVSKGVGSPYISFQESVYEVMDDD